MKQEYRPALKNSYILIKHKCYSFTIVKLPCIKMKNELLEIMGFVYEAILPLN